MVEEFYLACKSPINGFIEELSIVDRDEYFATLSVIYRPVDIKNGKIIYSEKIYETKRKDIYEINEIKAQFKKQQALKANEKI